MNKIVICTDYDSMGNHGRFPMSKSKPKKERKIKLLFSFLKNLRKK